MASFSRKIKRKRTVQARKMFMKHFKKTMRDFKKQVVCSVCGRAPRQGEEIDNWHIDQASNNIDLICTDCYTGNTNLEEKLHEN